MDDDDGKTSAVGATDNIESQCAVNSLILDYYKKFGKKRDLEQFFSLSTAQSDIRDTSGLFWRRMKSENDSSDSGEQKSSSAHELCRISIRCSMPEPSSSQLDEQNTKAESPNTTSPPIITEDPLDTRQTDDESIKSDDNQSQKSFDPLLDLSAHKPLSPSSSVTSQRKLEWDSLADVGYAYESERKTSASTLSTLERLALQQQYSNNDTKQDIGSPTCHSTPLDENLSKSKNRKNGRTTKITKKDFDFVELNLPQTSDTQPHQSIQVNLTKHISFHVEKDGEVTVDNIRRDVNISPEKLPETAKTTDLPRDKEIQTSLLKTNDRSVGSREVNKPTDPNSQKIPVMISLNTLRKKMRRKRSVAVRRKLNTRRKMHESKVKPSQEKSGGQLSEAESFEYMPGHIYNQNQLKARDVSESKSNNNTTTGNKSSLESSGGLTTDSSKGSKHSFTKDLEKCIEVLKLTLQKRYDDGELKKKLVKEIIQRLLNSKYRDDDTSTDFLSGLSFNSKNNDEKSNTATTSTSDTNNTDYSKQERPKKSILRMEKFDSKHVASTSQSVPNLPIATGPKNIDDKLQKKFPYNSGSNESSRWKISSENGIPKTSSEELYLKYLEALKREETYKKQLKDKEMFLKHKLAKSETVLKASLNQDTHRNDRLKQLMKDLTRSNCDDGSGDASKLEAGSLSDRNIKTSDHPAKSQRSHSVFTLSSSFSEPQRKQNIKTKNQCDQYFEAGTSRNHYCCCPHHGGNSKIGYCDSSVQVNIQYQGEEESNIKLGQDLKRRCHKCNRNVTHLEPEFVNSNIQNQCDICKCRVKPSKPDDTRTNYQSCSHLSKRKVCSDVEICGPMKESRMVTENTRDVKNADDCLVCKCCQLPDHFIEDPSNKMGAGSCKVSSGLDRIQVIRAPCTLDNMSNSTNSNYSRRHCKSSQTNVLTKMTCMRKNENNSDPRNSYGSSVLCALGSEIGKHKTIIHEATRCLQTEISIDPKISDPSLADITIINNCAELIGLNSREVIINTLDEMKTFTNVCTSSESGNLPLKSEDGFFQGEIKESDINIIESKDSNISLTNKLPKDYTIPIKGTNMTLMVSLASSESKQSKQKVNQQVGTEKPLIKEEGTCVSTECAKSVQCVGTPSNFLKNDRESSPDYNSNKSSNIDKSSPRKYQSNRSPTRSPQRNTYPKIVKIKENKLLRRSNTDTDKLKTCCAQAESYPMMPLAEKKPGNKLMKDTLKNQESEINMDAKMMRMNAAKDITILKDTKEIGIQKYLSDEESNKKHPIYRESRSVGTDIAVIDQGSEVSCQTDFREQNQENIQQKNVYVSGDNIVRDITLKPHGSKACEICRLNVCQCGIDQKSILKKSIESRSESEVENVLKDPIITVIQDITRRYSKGDITKLKKKKCFKEIVSVLNYLLETEEISDQEPKSPVSITPESSDNSKKSSFGVKILRHSNGNDIKKATKTNDPKILRSEDAGCDKTKKKVLRTSESESLPSKRDKSVQQSSKSTSKCTESSDMPCSTDRPSTSDSTACKIFSKIKKECEKYHMRRKCGRKCEISSSTSVNCEDCKKVHHCGCKHKCKRSKTVEKLQKKCVAYNLILQTSESMLSEETVCDNSHPLPNIVVKVPKRKEKFRTETCKETIYRIEKGMKDNSSPRVQRSKSCHKDSEVTSNDDFYRTAHCTVREYLEKNRPDFVEKSGERQNCLKFINEIRANERAVHRNLLSLQIDKEPDLTTLTSDQLRDLATQIGLDIRRKKPAPKFISEREMKKHSENIYKTLPEVVQKKENKKKQNIKKTNLLMANIFKKNLQKKTLRGSVNLSNYSTVIKI